MRKILTMLSVFICVVGVSGCGKYDVRNELPLEDPNILGSVEIVDYEKYAGVWAVDGATHDDIIADGGAELICSIENKNQFAGSLFTQQSGTERFASVDDISGIIVNDELYFSFEDDGWGGKGTLHIRFSEDKIVVETSEYEMAEDNLVGYGISGVYEMSRAAGEKSSEPFSDKGETEEPAGESSQENADKSADESLWEPTYEEMSEKFHEKFYAGLSWEEIEERVMEGNSYYHASKFYNEIINYWEQTRGVTDISNTIEPLYFTDMKYYSEEDFQNDPETVIHLAKNEIYAKHGYIFKNEDLNNYFMGCAWYQPACDGDEFDDAVFNDYEKKNLELLSALDKQ